MVPHPKAPLMEARDVFLILSQLGSEISSGRYSFSNTEFQTLTRQAGLVSLYFFLKYIVGLAGPFDLLNDTLHVEMCNLRQKWLTPGLRAAMFIPRGHYKTTVATTGGTIWELIRDPDLKIRITHAVAEKSQNFMSVVKETFEHNPKIRELYPEYCPSSNQPRWNAKEIVLPNRTKYYVEANVETGGIEGSSQGHHYNLHVIDDMIGDAALNSLRQSNAVMLSTKNWFEGCESLLVSPRRDRIIVVGTRYAVDDVYGDILLDARENLGYPISNWEPNPDGQWTVYYRKAIEDEKIIFPENYDKEFYARLAEKKWWDYVTQYLNDPHDAGLTDLSQYTLHTFQMVYDDRSEHWKIVLPSEEEIFLDECDVVIAADPAATERHVSAKTSRSAVVVLAQDPIGRKFILLVKAGYVSPMTFFDWLFEAKQKFERYARATYLEASGPFKIMGPLLRQEEQTRRKLLNLNSFAASGDKNGRIVSTLDPEFASGNMYVHEEFRRTVEEEQKAFPQSAKKDILDAITIAISNSVRPYTEEERSELESEEEWWRNRTRNAAGY
jgi:hypothetical protein